MQQHGSKHFFSADPSPSTRPWGRGQNVKIQPFLKHGHVAYQIKGNLKCSNMVAVFCPQTSTDPSLPTPTLGVRSKGQISFFFSEHGHVAYQI